MAFAPRPRTPVRRQSNETSSGTVNPTVPTPVRATPSAASGTNGTIQRLLDIVTQHGVQLASLKEDQEALRREVLEALRGGTSSRGGEKVPAEEVCKVASQKGRVGEGTTKAVSTETRRTSLCSTSSGSDAGGSTSSSRRSGRGTLPVPKVADLAKEKSSTSKASESEEVQCHRPVSAIPVPRLRSRSSSLPTTPRGANATRSITPRRSASGEPTPRRNASVKASNLYEIAKPLLQPGILREKRVVALSSFARCLKDGASPCHWSGPQTPLRCAVQAQDTEMAKLLIQARADPNERDAKGVCVLHSASFDGLTDLCQTLLKARADANVADQHGQTAFFFAPSSSVCDILMENKADVNSVNQKGQSALHLASRAGLTEVLLWMAPRVSREIMEMRDIHGATAAYYARHAGITGEFLMRHKFTGDVAADEKRGSDRRNVARGSNDSQPDTHQGSRSSKSVSWTSRIAPPLPPLLEDQLDGEDDDVMEVIHDTKEESQEVVATDPLEVADPEEPELPGTTTSLSTLEELPAEIHADMEVTSCYLEERSCELSIEPKESSRDEVDHEQMEVASPTSSLDRADQMVTWEEDCGCPGFALVPTSTEGVVSESPAEAAPEDGNSVAAPEDGNSVASDASDLASPSKVRNKRRSSLNQVFLRPLDPLKAEA